MTWTRFMDMHSGGGQKETHPFILIEAPEDEAVVIFYNRFGHNPNRVTCTCCGEDYSIDESKTLEQATAYNRHLRYASPIKAGEWMAHTQEERQEANRIGRYLEPDEPIPDGFFVDDRFRHAAELTLDAYLASNAALLIRDPDIADEERRGSVPSQGYVWVE